MRILITGAKGMLAQAVRKRFEKDSDGQANEIILTDRSIGADNVDVNGKNEISQTSNRYALDITDLEAVKALVDKVKPNLIINCAAYTNVDGAEQAEKIAERVNALGPENLAKAAVATESENGAGDKVGGGAGAILVHVSTDYVFGGAKPIQENMAELDMEPEKYVYSEDDEKNPQSVYGKTKLAGERAIEQQMGKTGKYYIFRTAWLYGKGGKNFVDTMIRAGKAQEEAVKGGEKQQAEVRVVSDQHGSPTYTEDLADIIYQAVYKQVPFGIYNATNEGFITWYDFTKKIYELAEIDCNVIGVSSEEYEAESERKAAEKGEKRIVAKRPLNSQMSKQKLLDARVVIADWEDALRRYLKETGNLKAKEQDV